MVGIHLPVELAVHQQHVRTFSALPRRRARREFIRIVAELEVRCGRPVELLQFLPQRLRLETPAMLATQRYNSGSRIAPMSAA